MADDLLKRRTRTRAVGQTLVLGLTVAFYLALVPVVVLFSGPIYQALSCTLGDCEEPGREVEFVMPGRGQLRLGSTIRLPNGEPIGEIAQFRRSSDERFTRVVGRIFPDYVGLVSRPLRCQAAANFSLQMDADLVVSQCPDSDVIPEGEHLVFVCGGVDHFERMGQELRRFVLDNVRPGDATDPVQITGPCGSDNENATAGLRALLANEGGR